MRRERPELHLLERGRRFHVRPSAQLPHREAALDRWCAVMSDHEFPADLADLDRASVARMVGTDLATSQPLGPPPDLDATIASFAALVRGAR